LPPSSLSPSFLHSFRSFLAVELPFASFQRVFGHPVFVEAKSSGVFLLSSLKPPFLWLSMNLFFQTFRFFLFSQILGGSIFVVGSRSFFFSKHRRR